MFNYSITPLDVAHLEEICQDIKEMYEAKIVSCPLFMMVLHPEGVPPIDKVTPACRDFALFRDRLAELGVPAGVLVQSSLGHGYALNHPLPFTPYKNLTDGEDTSVSCPMDERFREYMKNVMKIIASYSPSVVMLDDDCRLLNRPGKGCTCRLHMKELQRRIGKSITREELYEHIMTHPVDDELTLAYVDTQRESLHGAIVAMREGIDSVDPSIQGINCTSGETCEFVVYNNPSWAGKENPTTVRLPNGIYAPLSSKGFSDLMYRTAICKKVLEDGGIDIILTEGDTIPFNRYGRSASYFHSQLVAASIDGCKGSKLWVTRTVAYEPKSGKAFRKIMKENIGLYDRLYKMSREVKFFGCRIPFQTTRLFNFHRAPGFKEIDIDFATCVLERMGLPLYFSSEPGGATFANGKAFKFWSDEQIQRMFDAGSVFLSADCAQSLQERGFGEQLGVLVRDWTGKSVAGKEYFPNGQSCSAQIQQKELLPLFPTVETISESYHLNKQNQREFLYPAVSLYPRENGHFTVVYAGNPKTRFHYTEAFAFLNETRKEQFIALLKRAGELPLYYSGDAEILLRAGYLDNHKMLVMAWNLGFDVLPDFPLISEQKVIKAEYLDGEGKEQLLPFIQADGETVLQKQVLPMMPLVAILTLEK